jgi:hypothetical protein
VHASLDCRVRPGIVAEVTALLSFVRETKVTQEQGLQLERGEEDEHGRKEIDKTTEVVAEEADETDDNPLEIEGCHEGGIEFVDGEMFGEFVSEDGKVEEEDILVEEDLANVFRPVEGCVQETVEVAADVHLFCVFGGEEDGLSEGDVACHADSSGREGAGEKLPRALGEAEIEGGDEADVGEDDFPLEDGESQERENPPTSAPVGVEYEREKEIGAGIG